MKQKCMLNTFSSLVLQIITLISGFILPRVLIETYGSDTNGLVSSITQFLSVISLLDCGVGAVIQTALYEPLAKNSNRGLSEVVSNGELFFKHIAEILLIYIVGLVFLYPKLIRSNCDGKEVALLIIFIGASLLAQYYFGIIDNLLLVADQKGYILYISQIVSTIINTLVCVGLMKTGSSVYFMKFLSAIILVLRPIVVRGYVNCHYYLKRNVKYPKNILKQKWNGLAQHISYVVLNSTDIVVLSIFMDLKTVSIYSVYNLVISGLNQFLTALCSGFQAMVGNLWARKEILKLNKSFEKFEWLFHTITTFVFGCSFSLIIPFVQVYTGTVRDARYVQPFFAVIIVLATFLRCLSNPYWLIILAGGHYKQTQVYFIISALINIIISVFMVFKFGLIGVAIGTLIAMLYQVIWMSCYVSNNLIKWPAKIIAKQFGVDICVIVSGLLIGSLWKFTCYKWFDWIKYAIVISFFWGILEIVFNCIFYNKKMCELMRTLGKRIGE